MDQERGRFIDPEEAARAKPERRASIYAMPTLAVGEKLELKGLPAVVERIKPSGGLHLRFSTPMRIGFAASEPVVIKGVMFRVTWTSADKVGLRMRKGFKAS